MTPSGDIKTCRFLCRSGRGEAAGTRCLSEAVAPCPLSVPNHVASGVCSVSGGSKGCVRQRRPRGAVGQGQAPPGRSGRRRPGSQPGHEDLGAVRWPGPARCSWGSPSRHRGAERETAFPALGGSHQSNGRAGAPGPSRTRLSRRFPGTVPGALPPVSRGPRRQRGVGQEQVPEACVGMCAPAQSPHAVFPCNHVLKYKIQKYEIRRNYNNPGLLK